MIKNTIYIIACLFWFTVSVNAQTRGGEITRKQSSVHKSIDRNVDGVILGVSTKEDIIRSLKSRGENYDINEPSSNYAVIVSNGSFKYQGVEWQAVMYKLYENKVFVITYIKGVDKDKVNSLILTGARLNKRILNKYKKYHIKAEPRLNQYQDGSTFIVIELGKQYDQLSLGFGDIKVSRFLLSD